MLCGLLVTGCSGACLREDSTQSNGNWVLVSMQKKIQEWDRRRKGKVIYCKWKCTLQRKVGKLIKQVVPMKLESGVFIPPVKEIVDIPLTCLISSSLLGRTLHFLLFLSYLISPELSWHQIHGGSPSNHSVNEIIMTS